MVSPKSFSAIKRNSNRLSADFSGTYVKEDKHASDHVTERGRSFQIACFICPPWVCFLPFSVGCRERRFGTTGEREICTRRRSNGAESQAPCASRKHCFIQQLQNCFAETGRTREYYVTVSDKSQQIKNDNALRTSRYRAGLLLCAA